MIDVFSQGVEEEDGAECHAKPEDVLILTCNDNPRLECTSNNLHEHTEIKRESRTRTQFLCETMLLITLQVRNKILLKLS